MVMPHAFDDGMRNSKEGDNDTVLFDELFGMRALISVAVMAIGQCSKNFLMMTPVIISLDLQKLFFC